MKPFSSIILWASALISGLVLSGCAQNTHITHSYIDPVIKKMDLHGVMIVGVAQKQSARVRFEDELVNALKHHGVEAVASHTLLAKHKADAEEVLAAATKAGLDTVMVTRYLGEMSEEIYHPGTIYYGVTPAIGSSYYGGFGGYYYHAYEVAYQQPVWTTNVTHTLVSDLYVVKSKGHLWQAVSETMQAGSVKGVRDDAIKGLIGDLKDKGLVQ
ncbi:MAG: hypothetical protein ACJAYC_001002 [Halieaceae bacterium]|jgi:hypothetical protein